MHWAAASGNIEVLQHVITAAKAEHSRPPLCVATIPEGCVGAVTDVTEPCYAQMCNEFIFLVPHAGALFRECPISGYLKSPYCHRSMSDV